MSRFLKTLLALAFVALAVQVFLAFNFNLKYRPTLEIFMHDTAHEQEVEQALSAYEYEQIDDFQYNVHTDYMFAAEEISLSLGTKQYSMNDRTQIAILVMQAAFVSAFVLSLFWLATIAIVIFKMFKKQRTVIKTELKALYLNEVFRKQFEVFLIFALTVLILTVVSVFAAFFIVDFKIYIPHEIMPEQFIFKISQWSAQQSELFKITDFEKTCTLYLTAVYILLGVFCALLTASFVIWRAIDRRGK